MNKFVAGFAAFASLAMASPAVADPITLDSSDVGESFSIDFDGFADGTTINNLTSTINFTLDAVTSNSYTFSYLVSNTTDGGLTSRLSSFAFTTNPDISSATSTGDYPFTVLDSNYPNGIGTVGVCFKGGSSKSCAGNSGGVTDGNTGSGTLTLNFAQSLSSLTLDDFFVRYQSITGAGKVGSASGQQTSSTSTGSSTSGGTPVPAPGMLGLLAMALVALGLMRRRRRDIELQPQPS